MLAINGLLGITAQPHVLTLNATGRSERAGRVGMTYGTFVKRFCTIGWAFTGLLVAALVLQRDDPLQEPEQAFGYACLHLLGPGLTGLMVSCVLAANMSACSNFMVNTGAIFTSNFYQPFLRPATTDRELLWAGRISGLVLTLAGVGVALLVKTVLDAFLFSETASALVGLMFMGGFLWRRANRWGAAGSLIAAFGAYFAGNHLVACAGGAKTTTLAAAGRQLLAAWQEGRLGHFLSSSSAGFIPHWNAGVFGLAILAAAVAFVAVSLLTPPEDPQRIAAFFQRMKQSSDDDATGPAADRGQDMILLDLPGWFTAERWRGFARRYREDLFGFALAWLTVALLIGVAWGLMHVS